MKERTVECPICHNEDISEAAKERAYILMNDIQDFLEDDFFIENETAILDLIKDYSCDLMKLVYEKLNNVEMEKVIE